jgi:hypothetical protein
MYKFQKPYTLAGFEPGIFCSVGGRDDHYATPQWAMGMKIFTASGKTVLQVSPIEMVWYFWY